MREESTLPTLGDGSPRPGAIRLMGKPQGTFEREVVGRSNPFVKPRLPNTVNDPHVDIIFYPNLRKLPQ